MVILVVASILIDFSVDLNNNRISIMCEQLLIYNEDMRIDIGTT